MAFSSCEAKYYVSSLCACQVVWLVNLLKELGNKVEEVVTLLVDNVSGINLSRNTISHRRRKHI